MPGRFALLQQRGQGRKFAQKALNGVIRQKIFYLRPEKATSPIGSTVKLRRQIFVALFAAFTSVSMACNNPGGAGISEDAQYESD